MSASTFSRTFNAAATVGREASVGGNPRMSRMPTLSGRISARATPKLRFAAACRARMPSRTGFNVWEPDSRGADGRTRMCLSWLMLCSSFVSAPAKAETSSNESNAPSASFWSMWAAHSLRDVLEDVIVHEQRSDARDGGLPRFDRSKASLPEPQPTGITRQHNEEEHAVSGCRWVGLLPGSRREPVGILCGDETDGGLLHAREAGKAFCNFAFISQWLRRLLPLS